MRRSIVRALVGVVIAGAALIGWAMPSGADPTCAGVGALQVHGQHIVGDYVTAIGGISGTMAWPPTGGVVGEAIAGSGAEKPGQSGIHKHAPFAPGASFCVSNSNSPGIHIGS